MQPVLENIGTAAVNSEAERARFTAEAHVMRAFSIQSWLNGLAKFLLWIKP